MKEIVSGSLREVSTKGEVWKDVPLEEFKDFYEISNVGRLRSKPRAIERINRWDTKYTQYVGGRILSERTNGVDPHVYATLQFTHPETKKMVNKTVYPHKLVALAFIKKPNDGLDKVTFKDRNPRNIVPNNLLWTNQSYLSIRNMTEHPHNRNKMGDYQRKVGKPSDSVIAEVIKLNDEGFDVYTIGEMVGRSKSWGYSHVKGILKEKRIRDSKSKNK